jgi:ATP/maltotriose-dependent transcriptional regulator MalT
MRRGAQAARTLHRRAAEWHAHHGTPEDAVPRLRDVRDGSRVAKSATRSSGRHGMR